NTRTGWPQPLLAPGGRVLLTVGVQEREHLCLRHAGPQQPGCDEPLPLPLPNHAHDLQLLNVLLQPLLQVLWKGHGHCDQHLTNPLWVLPPSTPQKLPTEGEGRDGKTGRWETLSVARPP
ncbi:mCG145896, partial [Mus musculus]